MGSEMHGMPESKDLTPCHHCTQQLQRTKRAVLSYPYRRSGDAPQQRLPLLPHDHRPIHALGGNDTYGKHRGRDNSQGILFWLDMQIRNTAEDNDRHE